jgi:hypothetical protein
MDKNNKTVHYEKIRIKILSLIKNLKYIFEKIRNN